jgi:hypothetical protein
MVSAPVSWFGPQRVSFSVQFPGNPYDPAINDLRVKFVNQSGNTVERLAFYDNGAWRAILVAPQPGRYKPTLYRNGKPLMEEGTPPMLLLTQKLAHGFIKRNPDQTNRFQYDDLTPYFPLGFNLGWQSNDLPPMVDQIAKMGRTGLNWTRIWANSWDSKNPWWPQNDPFALPGHLWPPALDKWDQLDKACQDAGLKYQLVLFHHGAFSTHTDPNWPDHPWNAAHGGFLKDPADFFTDPEAKRRTKMWLRYAVARWSSSLSLLSWELFNEVEWTDAAKEGHWPQIAAWHKEMAEYIRSLDPYGHPVTTSSIHSRPEIWSAMDYYQPHLYSDSFPADLAKAVYPKDKPVFIGESGPDTDQKDRERAFLRNSIWQSLLRNDAGAAMYWYWDRVEKRNLYPEFGAWATALDIADFASHPSAKRIEVSSSVGTAEGVRELGWLLLRVRGAEGKAPKLSWKNQSEGQWHVDEVDLETGVVSHANATSQGRTVDLSTLSGNDVLLVLKLSD